MVGQLSAITVERCPRSTWNEACRVIHAAPHPWLGEPTIADAIMDRLHHRQRDRDVLLLTPSAAATCRMLSPESASS
jgi:hypothetical protein